MSENVGGIIDRAYTEAGIKRENPGGANLTLREALALAAFVDAVRRLIGKPLDRKEREKGTA